MKRSCVSVLSQPETEANEEEAEKESTDDPDPTEYKPDISGEMEKKIKLVKLCNLYIIPSLSS